MLNMLHEIKVHMTYMTCTMRTRYWNKYLISDKSFFNRDLLQYCNAKVEYVLNTGLICIYCYVLLYTFYTLHKIYSIYLRNFVIPICNTSYKYFICDNDVFSYINLQVLIMRMHNGNFILLLNMHQLDKSSKLMTHHTVTGGLYSLLTT